MLHLLFRLPAFLLLAPRLLPALGETGPDIVRALPCALLGGTRTFAQFLPGRQGDRLVLGEKAGPMADAAAQGDGRPQPVRGGKRAGGRPDVTTVPMLGGCADSGPAGRVEAEPWIRHPCPCLRLRPPAGPVAPGRGLGVGVHRVAGVDRPGRHCTVILLRGRQRDQLAQRVAVSAPDHSDHLPGKAGKRARSSAQRIGQRGIADVEDVARPSSPIPGAREPWVSTVREAGGPRRWRTGHARGEHTNSGNTRPVRQLSIEATVTL